MKKLFALFLSVIVCLNVFSGMAFAAPVAESDPETVFEMTEFNGTPDLIQKTIQKLIADGKVITEEEKPGTQLIDSVEASSGLSFDSVKTAVAEALTENREDGKIDVSRFNLNKSDAAELMDWVLKDYFLIQAVTDVKYVTNASGVTVEIRYTMSDGMDAALDEMQDEKEYFEENYDIGAAEEIAGEVEVETAEKKDYLAALDEQMPVDEPIPGEDGSDVPPAAGCMFHTVPYVTDPTTGQTGAYVNATWEMKKEMGELAPDYSNAELVFNPANGEVSVSAPVILRFVCTNVEFQCAKCGAPVSYAYDESLGENNIITNVPAEQTIYFDLRTGTPVTEKPSGTENVDWINYTNYAIAVFPDDNTDFANPEQTMVTVMHDAGQARVEYYYNQMSLFNALNADVFGVSSPYWTSKNTQNNPMAAVKVLCNMDANTEVPPNTMLLMVQMLPQAFMSYVMNYKTQLLAMKDLAMSKLAMLPSNATDVQKMLVLHDWLAEHATFDMGSMTNVTGSGGNNDPMQMTTFGAVLSMQLDNYYGGVCLAYAAAYNWLIQWAFPQYYQSNGKFLAADKAQHITDFVQIRFFANTSETSVAGAGFGGGYFNNVHYFNAVQAPAQTTPNAKDWFYVDVCYDDISVECIAQYRVEAEGNLSHMNFLTSPQTIASLYKSSTDYIDSLYDGYDYVLTNTPYTDDNGNIVYNNDGTPHYIYEKVRNNSETEYNNASYEDSWFSGAISPINFDGRNWYYVDSGNTYVAYKDYMDENGDFNIGNMGNGMGGNYNIEDILHDNRVDPANGDKLKVRAISAPDYYTSNNNGGMGGGMGGNMGQNTAKTDPYAEVLIKYGYGHVATNIPQLITRANDQRVDAVYANQSEGDANNNHAGMTGMLLDECQKDFAMNELYPGLVHTVALNDNILYFNLANKIYTLDLGTGAVDQLKEYNDVYAATDGRVFTGASYYSVPAGSEGIVKQVKNHPIASFAIRDNVTFTPIYINYGGQMVVAGYNTEITPSMVCAIATNYAYSYPTVNGSSSEFNSYTKEAGNYNPDYQRGVSDDSSNDNCEFLWCANIREEMPLEDMLAEYDILKSAGAEENESVVSVTVDSWCDEAAFTELRTVKYGLSDGSSKEYTGDSAAHHYEQNEDRVYVCRHCLAVTQNGQSSGLGNNFETEFVWETAEGTGNPVCTSVTLSCYYDGCSASDAHLEFSGNQITNRAGTNTYSASVRLPNGTTITDYKSVNPGDVDADDKINVIDLGALSDYIKNPGSSAYSSSLADINGDGVIDDSDLSVLRTILAAASSTTSSGVNSATLSLRADPSSIKMDSTGVATFDVNIEITGNGYWNRGISIMDVSLTYDSSILELKSVSEGSLMRVTNNTPNALMFETEDLHQSTTASGVLATLTFEINGQIEENTSLALSIKADGAARYNSQSAKYENVAVAGGNTTVNVTAYCAHEETTLLNAKEVTCTQDGYTGDKQCNKCGEIAEYGEILLANGHSLEFTKDPVDATCTQDGYTGDKACTVCDYVEIGSVIDATGHTEEIIPGKAATCTETGLTDGKKCSDCKEILLEQEEIAALGHTEVVDNSIAPTCTDSGLTEGKHCSVCSAILVPQEKVNALGHYMIIDAYKAPTCTVDGFEQGEHCSRCDEVTVAQVVIPALGHDMITDAYVAPTCTLTGLTAGEHCSRCDDKTITQEIIPALGHEIVVIEAIEATCTTDGITEGKYCSVCEETILAQKVIDAFGHDMITDAYVAPTCTETGLTEGEHCSRCDDVTVKQNEIAARGHDMITDNAVAATCTTTGLTAGEHCSRCDEKTVAQDTIPALGHDMVTDEAVAATCTTAGLTAGEHCSHCDDATVAQEEVKALGHTEATDSAVAATCTETGLTEGKHCSVCNTVLVEQEEIAVLGHDMVTDKAVAATCTADGLTEGEHCSRCDDATVVQEIVSAKGHSFDEWTQVKAPTLTEEGLEVSTCSVCGEKQTRAIEKLEYLVGDANSDGQITAADARILLRLSAKLEKLESYNDVPFAVLDVNGDGQITAADARKVLRMSAKLDD